LDKQLPAKRRDDNGRIEGIGVGVGIGFVSGFLIPTTTMPAWMAIFLGAVLYCLYLRWRYWHIYRLYDKYKAQHFDEVIELATRALEKGPAKVNAAVYGGAASIMARKPEEAIAFSDFALSLRPKNVQALINRSQGYAAMGDAENALADANEAIRLRPNLALAYFARGYAQLSLWRYVEAIEDNNQALKLKLKSNLPRINRSVAKLGLNKLQEVEAECDELFDLLSSKPSANELSYALMLKGTVLFRQRKFDEAIDEYTHGLDLAPQIKFVHLANRGHAFLALGKFDKAMRDLIAAADQAQYPKDLALVHSNFARLYLRQGEMEQALKESVTATSLWTNAPPMLCTYGLLLTRAGQLEKAQIMLDHAVSLDPYLAEAYWFRHELYEKLNQSDKSADDKSKAESFSYKPYI
jgi:tetratricopeptide (TPR) repeat protein